MDMIFFQANISRKAIINANKVLKSGWLSEGKVVKRFEDKLAGTLGIINPVAVNSGTSALHLALVVSGVETGDEVIIPAQTFVATGLAVLMAGAKPVFADIQYSTGNIAPGSVIKKITPRTKAVIPVHWAGYPCDMDEINSIAQQRGLHVIEDAAHAIGASYKRKPIGSVSEFTAFSFQAIKHLTTGDGGALCCHKLKDYSRAMALRWFGIDRVKSRPSMLGEREYDISECGYKYHMNDLAAALGLGNIESLKKNLRCRRQTARRYREALKNIPGLKLLDYKDDRTGSYWIFTILVEDRKNFIIALKKRGIPASVVHMRIDRNSVFGGVTPGLVDQERFDKEQVSIPIHEKLSDEDIGLIIRTIRSGW
jgi:perosamine synthetase